MISRLRHRRRRGVFGLGGCCCNCSQTFTLNGCSALAVPGATVNVYDHAGGTLLTSGDTDGSGNVTLTWPGTGSVYVTTSGTVSARFAPYGQSLVLTCGGSTTLTLAAATGYHCILGCAIPLPITLHITVTGDHPFTGTMTYQSTGTFANNWLFTATPGSITYAITIAGSTFGYGYAVVPNIALCSAGHSDSTFVCPMSFHAAGSWAGDFSCSGWVNGAFNVTE